MHLRQFCLVLLLLLASSLAVADGGQQPGDNPAATAPVDTSTPSEPAAAEPAPVGAGQASTDAVAESDTGTMPTAKDIVLVLDNSGSMKKNDPDRLTATAVRDFIGRLDSNTRVAIEIFDQTVRLPVPFTVVSDSNRDQVLQSLTKIDYNGKYTDSPAAIERAIYELKNNGRDDAQKVIVFMTDGIVDTGNANADLEKAKWLQNDLAPAAADAGIKIFAIAFTEQADFQLIQTLAQRTKGDYFRALNASDLTGVFERITTEINAPPPPPPKQEPEPAAKAPPAPPPAPVIVRVPQPVSGVPEEERFRSIIIVIAALVMIVTLVAIIFMLVRRGRQLSGPDDQYVAEAYLNDLGGNTTQPSYKLGSMPTMLGRVEGKDKDHLNYIVIPQSTIGRRHAMIEYKDFGYWIADQGSINGTFVNDKAISTEVRLKHGDRVRLHKFEFEFVMPEMSDAGMTVVSNTVFADSKGAAEVEETVMRGGAGASRPPQRESVDMPEPDFDIDMDASTSPEPVGEEDTVIRGGGDAPAKSPEHSSEDETLLPGGQSADSGKKASQGASRPAIDEETLMPGGGSAQHLEPDFDTDDETLMPSGPDPAGASTASKEGGDDEFFDITGSAKDEDKRR